MDEEVEPGGSDADRVMADRHREGLAGVAGGLPEEEDSRLGQSQEQDRQAGEADANRRAGVFYPGDVEATTPLVLGVRWQLQDGYIVGPSPRLQRLVFGGLDRLARRTGYHR